MFTLFSPSTIIAWVIGSILVGFYAQKKGFKNGFLKGTVTSLLTSPLFGFFIVSAYNKKNVNFYQGYGFGITGKLLSEGDPNARPVSVTQKDLESWNSLERFAHKHHNLFFVIGTLCFLLVIGGVYLLANVNIFLAVLFFFVALIPMYYFCRILFLIEGEGGSFGM